MDKAGLNFTPWPEHLQQEYRAKGYWSDEPLGELLQQSAAAAFKRTAIIAGDKHWSYQLLNERANQLAAGFLNLGLQPGARVVVQLPNSGELFEVLFALFRIGVAPVLALPSHRFAEISYFCSFAEADAYITCANYNGFDHRELARQLQRCGTEGDCAVSRRALRRAPAAWSDAAAGGAGAVHRHAGPGRVRFRGGDEDAGGVEAAGGQPRHPRFLRELQPWS